MAQHCQKDGRLAEDYRSGPDSRRYHFDVSDEMSKFIRIDNMEAVKVGKLLRFQVVKKMIKPASDKETCPDAHVRQGAGDLSLRAEEVGVPKICGDTSSITDSRLGLPRKAIHAGIRQHERQKVHEKYKEMQQELQVAGVVRDERVKTL